MIDFSQYDILVPPDLDETLLEDNKPIINKSGDFNPQLLDQKIDDVLNAKYGIEINNQNDLRIVTLSGYFDKRATNKLYEQFSLLQNVSDEIIIDFSKVNFINSFAMAPILSFVKDHKIYSLGLNNNIIGLIKILEVKDLFNFRNSIDEIRKEINIKKNGEQQKRRYTKEKTLKFENKNITEKEIYKKINWYERELISYGYRHVHIDPNKIEEELNNILWDNVILDFSAFDNIEEKIRLKDINALSLFVEDKDIIYLIGVPQEYIINKQIRCFESLQEVYEDIKKNEKIEANETLDYVIEHE